MKRVITVIAMLFVVGTVAHSQLRGMEDYTAELVKEAESGVKHKTDKGYILRYNYMEWTEIEMSMMINEVIRILEENDLDFTNPDLEESTFTLEREDYDKMYTFVYMMTGDSVRKAWGVDNDEDTYWVVVFQMDMNAIEITIDKIQKN